MSLLDFWDTQRPAAKRIKRTDSPLQKESDSEGREGTPLSSRFQPLDVTPALPDRDFCTDDVDDDPLAAVMGSQTELETSLPPVKTDKEAIEEYEASRAAAGTEDQGEEIGLQRRLGERKWQKGKSSIYVDAFNLALETVLDEEAHLFDEAEKEVFRQWKELSYESQYLYV